MPRTLAVGRVLSVGRRLAVSRRLRVSPLLNSLVAYWSLEEASGSRVDNIGGNTLTDVNTVTQNPGRVGNAAQFTLANSERLNIADNAALSTGDIDFTLAAWVYLDSKPAGNMNIIGKFTAGTNNREYRLYWIQSTDLFRFGVSATGTGETAAKSYTTVTPSLSTWYFIVAWHDSVNDTIHIQINDGAVQQAAHSLGVFNSASAFQIGARGDSAEFWDGRIDEVGMWKRVLTTTEKTWLYNGGAGRSYAEIVLHG